MSAAQLPIAPESPQAPPAWHMYRALVGIGLLCGLLIVGVFQWTLPIITANKAEALRAAIFEVLPAATSSETFSMGDDGSFAPAAKDREVAASKAVYAGYDDAGKLVGVAIPAQGMGYQDVIHLLYGYSLSKDAVVGIKVLESRETPGLGDKIEKDPDFLRNFERLEVVVTSDGDGIEHPIEAVKHGRKTSPWQIDAITGATISSNAIADILEGSTGFWVPRVERRASELSRREVAP